MMNGEILENGNYEIGNICIIPEYQKKGIDTKILKDKLEEYKNYDIEIQYFKQNTVGKLYEILGFVPNGKSDFHYKMIKKKGMLKIMKKDLYKISVNNTVDYEAKLNDHADYLKMLSFLEKKCKFIGIVGEHEIVKTFKDDIFLIEESSSWWTQLSYCSEKIYYINASSKLFDFLKKYETFCKTVIYKNIFIPNGTLRAETTDFGYNDIAFFGKNDNILLATVTHEGFIYVDKSIDKLFRK